MLQHLPSLTRCLAPVCDQARGHIRCLTRNTSPCGRMRASTCCQRRDISSCARGRASGTRHRRHSASSSGRLRGFTHLLSIASLKQAMRKSWRRPSLCFQTMVKHGSPNDWMRSLQTDRTSLRNASLGSWSRFSSAGSLTREGPPAVSPRSFLVEALNGGQQGRAPI